MNTVIRKGVTYISVPGIFLFFDILEVFAPNVVQLTVYER
jgi:hypothetical protein